MKPNKKTQKGTKKKTDEIVCLILLSLLQPGEFLCRTDGTSKNSIHIFYRCLSMLKKSGGRSFFLGFLRIIAVKIQHIKYEKTKKRTVNKMIKEKFLNLVNVCKNDRDMLDIIESDMRALGEYVYAVHMMETYVSGFMP